MSNKAEEGVVSKITPVESDLAYKSEDWKERVDIGSIITMTKGDMSCDKQITPNKNLRATNPKKRGEPMFLISRRHYLFQEDLWHVNPNKILRFKL